MLGNAARCLAWGWVWAATAAYGAGQISGLTVSTPTVSVGQTLQITVSHSGAKCGYKVLRGDGGAIGPLAVAGPQATLPTSYAQAGQFTIEVVGQKKGPHPKCAIGPGAAPVSLLVATRGGPTEASTFDADPARKLLPAKPPPVPIGERAAKGIEPKGPILQGVRPHIESLIFAPGAIGAEGPGILAPGGRLYLKGRYFGAQKGAILLEVDPLFFPEYPSGRISLKDVHWSNDRVDGRIPLGMTRPLQEREVRVVVRRKDGIHSNRVEQRFEVPVETRILRRQDPEVRLIRCGSTASENDCQLVDGATLSGRHANSWGASGSYNVDEYAIELTDGWMFNRVTSNHTITGDDGDYVKDPEPLIPVMGTSFFGKIRTFASSDDKVVYRFTIEVIRPKGVY